jgi:hypothetical protein
MRNAERAVLIVTLTLGLIASSVYPPADAWMLDSSRKETKKARSDKIFEAADKGDMGTASLDFQDELPDLIVSNMRIDFDEKTICVEISNTSSGRKLRNVEVAFYCYGKRGGRRYRKEIGRELIPELPCGSQNGVEITLTTATENVYRRLEVLVDPQDKIVEKVETNNSKRFKTKKMPPPGLMRIEELEL